MPLGMCYTKENKLPDKQEAQPVSKKPYYQSTVNFIFYPYTLILYPLTKLLKTFHFKAIMYTKHYETKLFPKIHLPLPIYI